MVPNADVNLGGLWLPIVTPFTESGAVDAVSLRKLADRLLSDGADGLVALGTTGEPATLTADERRVVVEICDAACTEAGRSLIVGAGTNSTAGTTDEIRNLTERTSACAALIVVPYYTRPSEQAVIEHFNIVADESPVPLVLYNVPYRTGRGLDSAALVAASSHPNIIGLKQAVGALDLDTLQLISECAPGFEVLAGDDAFVTPTLLMGGVGTICAAAHLCTASFAEMVAAARRHDVSRAVTLSEALLPVVTAGFAEPNPSVWKGALARQGEIASSYVRRPLTGASQQSVDRLLDAAAKVG